MQECEQQIHVEPIAVELMEAFEFKLPAWELQRNDINICVEYAQKEDALESTYFRTWASVEGMNIRGLVLVGEVPHRKKKMKQVDLIIDQLNMNDEFIETVAAFAEMAKKFSDVIDTWQKE